MLRFLELELSSFCVAVESKSRSILFLFFLFCFCIWVQALWGAIEPKRICDDKKLSQLKDFFCYICLLPFRFGFVLFLFVCFFLVLRRIIKTWSILQTLEVSARDFFSSYLSEELHYFQYFGVCTLTIRMTNVVAKVNTLLENNML